MRNDKLDSFQYPSDDLRRNPLESRYYKGKRRGKKGD